MKKTTATPRKRKVKSRSGKSDITEKRMSLDEAIQVAVGLQRKEKLEHAENIYQMILERLPENPDALHFMGILRGQQRKFEAAGDFMKKSLQFAPQMAGFWNNYGNILVELQRPDEAIDAYGRCLELAPDFAEAYNNLGVVQKNRKNQDIAAQAYQRAIELRPDYAEAWFNLAVLRTAQGRINDSVVAASKAIALRPENASSRRALAHAYCMSGEYEKAKGVYEEWIKVEPHNPIPRHHLAGIGVGNVPQRATDDYVRTVFDTFASSFDAKLAQLDYTIPKLAGELVAELYGTPDGTLRVLDAGCGTGLCGLELRPYAKTMDGVDLAPKMLQRASDRNIYDSLSRAELTQFMQGHVAAYDLIVLADTFCYFGDLGEACAAAAASLNAGGRMIFSVEKHEDGSDSYRLHDHGRYSHSPAYISESLTACGFELEISREVTVRLEVGIPVAGLLVSARKPNN